MKPICSRVPPSNTPIYRSLVRCHAWRAPRNQETSVLIQEDQSETKGLVCWQANQPVNRHSSKGCSQESKHRQPQHSIRPDVCVPLSAAGCRSQVAHLFPSATTRSRPSRPAATICQNSVNSQIHIVSYHHQISTCHQPTFGSSSQPARCTICRCCHRQRTVHMFIQFNDTAEGTQPDWFSR